jgi:hypothetical protein
VLQISLEWPVRLGTVPEDEEDVAPTARLIGWDDGRQCWIRDEEVLTLRICRVSDDAAEIELTRGTPCSTCRESWG